MKLAEALILRADTQRRLNEIHQRLMRNVKVQEGDDPAEDPQALMDEYDRTADELERLIRLINHTNSQTIMDNDMTLTDALAKRDVLLQRNQTYRHIADEATIKMDRYSKSEVRFVSMVDVSDVQKKADDYARQYRELDATIQATNWTTELIEDI
jgi:hypothetical protein